MRSSSPKTGPTDPGIRVAGGSGLLQMIPAVSVIPYISITGAPNSSSTRWSRAVGSGADTDRISRMPAPRAVAAGQSRTMLRSWVGTAWIQVGRSRSSARTKVSVAMSDVTITLPPALRGVSSRSIRPPT